MGLTTDVLVILLICKVCAASPIYNSEVDVVSDINTILDAIANLTKNLKSGEELGNKALQQIKSNNKLLKGDFDLAVSQAHSFAVRLQIYEETRGRDISDCVDDFKSGLEQLSIDLIEYAKDCYNEAKDNVDDFIQDFNLPNSTDIVDEVEKMFKNCDNIFCKQTTGEYGLLRVSEYKLIVEMYSLIASKGATNIRLFSSECLLPHYENALDEGHKAAVNFKQCTNFSAPIYNSDIDAVIDINTILEAISNSTKNLKSVEEIRNKTIQQIKRNNKLLKGDFDLVVSKAHSFAVRLKIYEETRGRDISDCVEDLKSDFEQMSNDLTYHAAQCYDLAKVYLDNIFQDFDMPHSTDIVDEVEAMFKNCDNIFCKQTTGEYGLLRVSEYKLLVEMYSLMARERGASIRILVCTASPIYNGEVDVISDINTILDAIANLTKNLKSGEEIGNKALQQIKSNNKLLKSDFDSTVSQAHSFAVRLQIYEETRGRDISDCVDDFKSGLKQLSIELSEYAKDCYNQAEDYVDDLIQDFNMPNSTDIVDEVKEMFKNCDNIFCKQTTGEYGLLKVNEYKLMVKMYSLLASEKASYIRITSSICLLPHYEEALDEGHRSKENFKKCANTEFLPTIKH